MDRDPTIERVIVATFVEKGSQAGLLDFIEKPRARAKLRRELFDLRRIGTGWGTLVSCVPHRLLYYEGEHRLRAILSSSVAAR
jgi:hypothetical protein